MAIYNEDRMEARLNNWSGGKATVLAIACAIIGFVLGAMLV